MNETSGIIGYMIDLPLGVWLLILCLLWFVLKVLFSSKEDDEAEEETGPEDEEEEPAQHRVSKLMVETTPPDNKSDLALDNIRLKKKIQNLESQPKESERLTNSEEIDFEI